MGTQALTVLAVLVGVVGVGSVVGWHVRHRGPHGWWLPLVGAGALASAGAVALAVVVVVARPRWLLAAEHLVYLVATIALPATGLAVAVAVALRRGRVAVGAIAAVTVLAAPVGWYGTHVAPYRLEVDREVVALPPERAGSDPITVGVLTDLQTTRITGYEQGAVDELVAASPDIVVLGGDLFDGTDAQLDEEIGRFRELLGQIHAPGGVYAVRGDTDTGDRLDRLVEGTGIEILDNEIVTIEVGDRTVRLGGSPLRWAPPEGVAMRTELAASDPADVRILLAHRPEIVRGLEPDEVVDLTIAGHTHGGQVAIPGIGPVIGVYALPRSVAAGGLHDLEGHRLYVSTGVGMVRGDAPQVRLFTRPSIAVITLR